MQHGDLVDTARALRRRSVVRRPALDAQMLLLAGCFLSFILICLPGCSSPSDKLPVYAGDPEPGDPAYQTKLQIKYLGAGGVVIKRGDDVLLTAPFFSNPSIPRVAFGKIRSLPEQINRFLDKKRDTYLAAANAILVGHAHYDHLMDVPYIKREYMPQARVYGSKTMKNILSGARDLQAGDIVSVEEKQVGTFKEPGKWWYPSPRLRFMALESEHAPILFGLKLFEGTYSEPLPELPTRASGWREGQTLAYLIDFLGADGKTVEFRVHYQDAASTAPLGFPPLDKLDDQRPIDLAIVCMPGFDQVKHYPDAFIKTFTPQFVVIVHWENFFEPLPDVASKLRTVPTENAERFLAILNEMNVKFKLPAPGAWMHFPP